MSVVGVLMSDAAIPYPLAERRLVKYQCSSCKRFYERVEGGPTYSCCVLHSPGSCCHAFEVELHKKGWRKKVTP